MTTPNIDTELYLPKTYTLVRRGKGYNDLAYMTQQGNAVDSVYLPKGLSLVTVTATGFDNGRAQVSLFGAKGFEANLTERLPLGAPTERLWLGQISNPGEGASGMWMKVQLQYITTAGQNNGSVSIQVVNFPPEN